MADRLTETDIQARLEDLDGWMHQGDMIRKTYRFATFPAAIAFVTHVAFLAEHAGHHPDIDIRYNAVTLALTTHDAGGLTAKDFDLARTIDRG